MTLLQVIQMLCINHERLAYHKTIVFNYTLFVKYMPLFCIAVLNYLKIDWTTTITFARKTVTTLKKKAFIKINNKLNMVIK